jgi:hypothetical protein
LAVLAAGPSTSRGREPAQQATRVTQKVQEAGPAWSKLKGKGKGKGKGKVSVVEEVCEELQKEELERLMAKKAAIQEMIDNLQK